MATRQTIVRAQQAGGSVLLARARLVPVDNVSMASASFAMVLVEWPQRARGECDA